MPKQQPGTTTAKGTALATLESVAEQARAFAAASRADRTRREYAGQWLAFATWCSERGLAALPAEPATVALYLTERATAGLKPSSLGVAIAAVAAQHRAAGVIEERLPHRNPQVAEIWRGIRRSKGTAPRRVAPALAADLRQMAAALRTRSSGRGTGPSWSWASQAHSAAPSSSRSR